MERNVEAPTAPHPLGDEAIVKPGGHNRASLGSVFLHHRGILPATVGELPSHTFSVKPGVEALKIVKELERDPELPGVLIVEGHRCVGMVSRQKCFEHLGQPFGVEVFLNRPIATLNEAIQPELAVMPGSTRIERAVEAALSRTPEHRYEPIVVQHVDQSFQLLDVHVVLLAQTRLLANAHRLVKQQIDIGRALSGRQPDEDILPLIMEHLETVVPYNRGGILLQIGEQLEFRAQHGFPLNTVAHPLRSTVSGNDLYRHLTETKAPVLIPDTSDKPRWTYLYCFPTVRTALAVPLVQADVVVGMLLLMRVFANVPFADSDLGIAQTFAAQATLALQNARLAADQHAVAARQKALERFRAPAWHKLIGELRQVLSALNDISHKMLEVPVDAFGVEQRQQFMALQSAGRTVEALLDQAATSVEDDALPSPD